MGAPRSDTAALHARPLAAAETTPPAQGAVLAGVAAGERWAHAALYDLLETQIVPSYYERDANGIPRRWLTFVRQAIATVAPRFSARRMVKQYVDTLYAPALRARVEAR